MAEDTIPPAVQAQLDGIMKKLGIVTEDNATLKQENSALKQQMLTIATNGAIKEAEEAKEAKVPTETFKAGKESFKFNTAKFILPGVGEVTALDALADTTTYDALQVAGKPARIVDWLVAVKSGVIEPA